MRRSGLVAVVSGGLSFERGISLGQGLQAADAGSSTTPRRYLLSPPARRADIPKPQGGRRALGVFPRSATGWPSRWPRSCWSPHLRGRFAPCSYGFARGGRPRSAPDY
jgi:hypothetical protein